jgi:hypothetical protein
MSEVSTPRPIGLDGAMFDGDAGAAARDAAHRLPAHHRAVRRRDKEAAADIARHHRADLLVPAALIAAGLAAAVIEGRLVVGGWDAPLVAGYVGLTTVLNLGLIYAALWLASRMFNLGLGETGPAALKIVAAAILPAAAGGIIRELTGGGVGELLAYAVSLGFAFALLCRLFDMDGRQTVLCTAIIWVVRTWVGYAIVTALFHAVAGGALPAVGGGIAPGGQPAAAVASDGDDEPADASVCAAAR